MRTAGTTILGTQLSVPKVGEISVENSFESRFEEERRPYYTPTASGSIKNGARSIAPEKPVVNDRKTA